MSNGAAWAQTRRFTLATLRDFGMGKRGLEEQVQEETGLLLQELARAEGRPLDPGTLLTAAVGNTICRILFGHRFDYGDQQYLDVLRRVAQNFLLESSAIGKAGLGGSRREGSPHPGTAPGASSQLYNILPGLLERLPGSHWTFFHNTFFVQDFLTRKVEENAVAGEPTTAPRDFADAFLRKMEQEKENPETAFTQDNLRVTVFDVFLAGTETTSMTLRYCLMVLLRHPDVAEKIQEEIERVIGTERPPALRDRAAMPYTDAVIHEVQRYLDLIPLGFIRTVARDTPLGGFTIPKGCTIYPVLSSALRDPRYFKNPETFDPQHFLDEKGAFRKNEAFIPFSAGKRMCLGESMARTQLFLFLTALLQRFRLRIPPGEAPPDLSPLVSGISNVPRALRVCFCPR
ncbi:Cytochrome P450 2H2-like protein [Aix galericulata]|nr:Cytochrome P450 2H2-like protein [Aix galericulata]